MALLIPLAAGGNDLAQYTRGIGVVEGEFLKVVLLPWLFEKLGAAEGSMIHVDNDGGKFNMRLADTQPGA